MNDGDEFLRIGERYMRAVADCDVETVREMYADDAVIWHNFDQAEQSIDDNIRTLRWIHGVLHDIEYQIVRREPIPDGFYQQHILRGTLADGEAFAMPACAIVKIAGGRIASLHEYLDTAHTRPLSSGGG